MEQLLNVEVKEQIKEFLSHMKNEVKFILFTQKGKCETCKETKLLLKEVSELNEKLSFVEKDINIDIEEKNLYGITLVPSFVLLDNNNNYKGVKFNGIPAGHEINSFLTAILDMSGINYGFDPSLIDRIKKINKPVNIKVFVTLSCPHCPGAVVNAHRLAMLNENILSEMIEAQTFQELSVKYKVSGVPKIIINETHELVGNQPLEEYLNTMENL